MSANTRGETYAVEAVTQEDVLRAGQPFQTARDWLAWILTFAQTPLDQQSHDRIEQARVTFLAFLWSPQGPGLDFAALPSEQGLPPVPGVPEEPLAELPSVEELRETHGLLRNAIEHLLAGQPYDFGPATHARKRLVTLHGLPWVIEVDDSAITAEPFPIQVRWSFGQLINYLSRAWMEQRHASPYLRECPAPIPRKPGACGRWFVGRGDQRYCSAVCQNRESSRAARARKADTQPPRLRGRPRKTPPPSTAASR
jgi:hypothetical protein